MPSRIVLIFLGLLIVVGGSSSATADGYAISVSDSLDTPTRTITLSGDEYNVSAIARVKPGESFTVNVSSRPSADSRVLIFNADQQLIDQAPSEADDRLVFTAPNPPFTPGSYAISLSANGTHQTIHPLVIQGFRVTLDGPSQAEQGSTIDVTVSITRTVGQEPSTGVEIAIVNETNTFRVTATNQSTGTYTVSVSLSSISSGDYRMYAAVRGTKEAFGEEELLGISDQQWLRIATNSSSEPTDDEKQADPDEDNDGSGPVETDTATDNSPITSVATVRTGNQSSDSLTTECVIDRPRTAEQTSCDFADQMTQTATSPTEAGQTATRPDVITPAPTPATTMSTNTPAQRGFGVRIALFALALGGFLAKRRSK